MAKKITPLEKVVEMIRNIHGDNIVMDESSYKGISKHAMFTHKIHGKWPTQVRLILEGRTHKKASYEQKIMPADILVERLKHLHEGKVTMVECEYKGTHKDCTFIHSEEGSWVSTPNSVVNMETNHPRIFANKKILKEEEVGNKILRVHGSLVTIVWNTYKGTDKKATFYDSRYGYFDMTPDNVFAGQSHPDGSATKIHKTNMDKYGSINPMQNSLVALKCAKSQKNSYIRTHWKTGEELVCQASWEPKVVDYLNNRKIDFLWQSQVFTMPNGKTYRPDLFLVESQTWVEIKGWMRPKSQTKWDWFLTQFPNSELWDKKKLKEMGIL